MVPPTYPIDHVPQPKVFHSQKEFDEYIAQFDAWGFSKDELLQYLSSYDSDWFSDHSLCAFVLNDCPEEDYNPFPRIYSVGRLLVDEEKNRFVLNVETNTWSKAGTDYSLYQMEIDYPDSGRITEFQVIYTEATIPKV